MDDKALREYADYVAHMASTKDTEIIQNRDQEHAAVLFKAMFDNAKSRIRIFSGGLIQNFYGDTTMIESARRFLERENTRIEVIVESDLDGGNSNPFVELLNRFPQSNYLGSIGTQPNSVQHFVTMDDIGFRFEEDKETFEAVACFNDPTLTKDLIEVFENLKTNSIQIS